MCVRVRSGEFVDSHQHAAIVRPFVTTSGPLHLLFYHLSIIRSRCLRQSNVFFFLLVLFCGAHNFFLNYYFINFDNTLAGVSSSAMRLLLVCYLCICLLLYTHIYHQLLCKFLICFPWPLHMKRCPFHIGLLVVVIFGQ